jgi:transposase InsO family protein
MLGALTQEKPSDELEGLHKIAGLRSDNGGEYVSKEFTKFCLENGIKRELTIAQTPEQNGVAERCWRTLFGMTRSMLKEANLENKWWGKALITATYLRNRCLSNALPEDKTPFEMMTGRKPNLSNIRIFSCKVYSHDESPSRDKLDDKALPGIFMGYGEQTKSWVVYLPSKKKLVASRNVEFLESGTIRGEVQSHPKETPQESEQVVIEDVPLEEQQPQANNDPEEPQINLRRSTRVHKPPGEFWKAIRDQANIVQEEQVEFALMIEAVDNGGFSEHQNATPTTYAEAAKDPSWAKATQEEFDSLMENNTWSLTTLPPGRKAIGSKWVYKLKENADGTIAKYKARLVAKGYTQREGIDFTETFAPVVKFTTIRTLLALAALKDYSVNQMDVSTAYLLK